MFKFKINSKQNPSQTNILVEIERLVSYFIKHAGKYNAFTEVVDRLPKCFDADFFATFNEVWSKLISVYSKNHGYAALICAFWRGCYDCTSSLSAQFFSLRYYRTYKFSTEQILSIIRNTTYHILHDPDLKRMPHDARYALSKRQLKLQDDVYRLCQEYSKLLVVRVDFAYEEKFEHLIGIDDVYKHLKAFNRKKETDIIFKHLLKRAWVIEQGDRKGYHIHAIYFFDGNRCLRDMYYAKELGKQWKSVTKGMGYYYNCNADKAVYESSGTLGIGMILRNDAQARKNLAIVVGYIADPTKEFQHLRMWPLKSRAFGSGLSKKSRKKLSK